MSNALAVASVSFVMVDLLNNGLIDKDISSTGVGDVAVTAWPPDRVDGLANNRQSLLNLFLYNVTENQGWRNVALPSRDSRGVRTDNPPLALNLHYLLTAYGAEQLHSEILLGYGMQLFHETPILTRDAIRRSLSAPSQVTGGGGLPGNLLNLFTSELAEQVEIIKIWPQTLTTEEISRLWTAFQAHYRPTAAYQASVVLIESRASVKSALPVRSRMVRAVPLQRPIITQVLRQAAPNAPITADPPILAGYRLVLRGSQLKGEDTLVLVDDIELIPLPENLKPDQIIIALPGSLEAGTHTVQVVQRVELGSPPAPHRGVESNGASFTLAPGIQTVTASGAQGAGTLDLTVNPLVGAQQKVAVLLNELQPLESPPPGPGRAYTLFIPSRIDVQSPPASLPLPSAALSVDFSGIVPGSYLVRVQIDGAESPLESDPSGTFSGPLVQVS